MADKRMFAKTIIDSDAFLDMPLSTQCLYFHLNMRADDDGFINNPRKIQRMIGASIDDLRLLIAKNFVIPFESGVVVIKHWKIHNYIQKDRYKETVYKEEKAMLTVKENKSYSIAEKQNIVLDDGLDTERIQPVHEMDTQIRLDKSSIDKNSIVVASDHISDDEYDVTLSDESSDAKKKKVPVDDSPVLFQIPLNDGTMKDITKNEVERYKSLYPAVNVEQEIRNIIGWNMSNPGRRKTRKGIDRHVNSWLADKQNKGRVVYNSNGSNSRQPYVPVPESLPTDYDENPFKR